MEHLLAQWRAASAGKTLDPPLYRSGLEVGQHVMIDHPDFDQLVGGVVTGEVPQSGLVMVRMDGTDLIAPVPMEMIRVAALKDTVSAKTLTLYRGIHGYLPLDTGYPLDIDYDDLRRQVEAFSNPYAILHLLQARGLVDRIGNPVVMEGHGVGVWWTSDRRVAEDYSEVDAGIDFYGETEIGIVLTGEVSEDDVVYEGGGLGYTEESPYVLKPGGKVTIVRVEATLPKPGDPIEGPWPLRDLGPVRMVVGVKAGSTVPGVFGSTWRGFTADDAPPWMMADFVILSQRRGRQRYYEVFTFGRNWRNFERLEEAKAAVEAEHGPLTWRQKTMPKVWVEHYYFGPTTEFTDPLVVYLADL